MPTTRAQRNKSTTYYWRHREKCLARSKAHREAKGYTPVERAKKARINRSPINVIRRAYANIVRRVEGKDPNTPLSKGMPLGFSREEFIAWTANDTSFWRLYAAWHRNQFKREFAPSIDRINDATEIGYVFGNVQWIVWRENHAKFRPRDRRLHWVTYDGRTQTVSQWAREKKMGPSVLNHRLRIGWSVEDALNTPKFGRTKTFHSELTANADALNAMLGIS